LLWKDQAITVTICFVLFFQYTHINPKVILLKSVPDYDLVYHFCHKIINTSCNIYFIFINLRLLSKGTALYMVHNKWCYLIHLFKLSFTLKSMIAFFAFFQLNIKETSSGMERIIFYCDRIIPIHCFSLD